MQLVTLTIPETLLKRLETLADAHAVSLDALLVEALESYADSDDDEPSKEAILDSMKASLQAALAGEGQDAFEAIAELRQELLNDAD